MVFPARLLRALSSLLLLAVATSAAAAPPFLRGYEARETATGRMYARGWSAEDQDAVARELPRVLREIEDRLQRRLGHPFTTVLVPDRRELRRVVERLGARVESPERVLGIAFPALETLVVRQGLLPGTSSFHETLAHEVAHLVIHARADARVPRWFDEGVAMWVSGASVAPRDEAYLSFLARLGALYPLRKLEYRFPRGERTTSVSYRESLLLITYLVKRYGDAVIPRLLALFEAGRRGMDALEEVTGTRVEDLEAAFGVWVAVRHSWLSSLASVVGLWTLTALLALVAIGVHLVRRRRGLRRMAAAERAEERARESLEQTDLGAGPE